VFVFISYQDGKTGEISIYKFLPLAIFWKAYIANIIGIVILILFVAAYAITSKLKPETLKIKIGDFLGVPAAISMMAYMGWMPMAAGIVVMLLAFYTPVLRHSQKKVRFLPKVFAGTTAAFIVRILFIVLVPGTV
jgi:uncharacterized membrane protein